MYIGSVRFYRHLILSIIGIVLIALLISTVVLGVSNFNTATELKSLRDQNSSLTEQVSSLKQPSDPQTDGKNESESSANKPNHTDLPSYSSLFPDMVVKPIEPKPEAERGKTAYLSFDDGPSVQTPLVLDILKQNNVKATFFVVGNKLTAENISYLNRIADEGHAIGVHSFTHDYAKIYASVDAYLEDFYTMWQRIYDETGIKSNIFRFPGGSINSHNKAIFQNIITEMMRRGFTYYDWNVDSGDADGKKQNATALFNNINATFQKYNEPVVLMHDEASKQFTPQALPKMIQAIQAAGYGFGTLDQRDSCFYPYSAAQRIN